MSDLRSFILAKTPSGWTTRPLWSLFRRRKTTGHADEELLSVYRDHGVIPKSSRDDNFNKESDDLSNYQLVTEGALVTNKMKAWQGSIAISRFRGIVSPAYYVYEPLSGEYDQFLHYLLRSEPYIALYRRISKGVRVNQWDLEHEALRNVPVMLPDRETQKAIADFLDRETARIDQLIEKKQRFILLLRERESALALEMLSGCGSTGRGRKHSRLPAVDTLPAHWSEQPLKQVAQVIDCKHTTPSYIDHGVPLISTGEVKPYAISFTSQRLVSESDFRVMTEGGRDPRPMDIIYSRNASVGSAARVGDAPPFCMGQDICLVRPTGMCTEFLEHQLNSEIVFQQLSVLLVGSTLKRVNVADIKNFTVLVPPANEQIEIASKVTSTMAIGRRHGDLVARSVERLREFRAALITAAVTGQIDVTTRGKEGQTDRRLDQIEEAMGA